MRPPAEAEVAALVRAIEERAGVMVPARDHGRLIELVTTRAAALRLSGLSSYLALLLTAKGAAEWRELLARLTVKESFLFRAPQQFQALAERIVPELVARRTGRGLRLWSAGCARGEEAATLAVVLAGLAEVTGTDWKILATDIDEEALEVARSGRFGRRAVAQVPPPLLERHFHQRSGSWVLRSGLLSRIEFRALNLVASPLAPPGSPFDVILLRNVLIYFREEAQERVVGALMQQLEPDGYLFLGPAESLLRLDTAFEAVDLGTCFAYRKRRAREDPAPTATARPQAVIQPPPPAPQARAPLQPPDPGRLVEEAVTALAEGRPADGARLAESAAQALPEDPVARGLLGLCRERSGEVQEAIQAYRAALYLAPGLVHVRFLLAQCLAAMGWSSRARGEHREILAALRADAASGFDLAPRLELPSFEEIAAHSRRYLELEDSGPVRRATDPGEW